MAVDNWVVERSAPRDDDLIHFAAEGAPPLPAGGEAGYVDWEGARIWYGLYGRGSPVVLLHGSFDNSQDWGYQVRALTEAGYSAITIDSRGRGRSTLGTKPLTFELLAGEVLAVLDALAIDRSAFVGWSDGAIIALTLAMTRPARVGAVFAFGVIADLGGLKEFEPSPVLDRAFGRAKRDYARLAPAPDSFGTMAREVNRMDESEPNYSARDLVRIRAPVAIVMGEKDEFVRPEHTDYLAAAIPNAERVILPGVSHFAMLQRPDEFNRAMLAFLRRHARPRPDKGRF